MKNDLFKIDIQTHDVRTILVKIEKKLLRINEDFKKQLLKIDLNSISQSSTEYNFELNEILSTSINTRYEVYDRLIKINSKLVSKEIQDAQNNNTIVNYPIDTELSAMSKRETNNDTNIEINAIPKQEISNIISTFNNINNVNSITLIGAISNVTNLFISNIRSRISNILNTINRIFSRENLISLVSDGISRFLNRLLLND
jgi:hypothetical protein